MYMIILIFIGYLMTIILDLIFTVIMNEYFPNASIEYYHDMNEVILENDDTDVQLEPEYLINTASFIPLINLISILRKIKYIFIYR